MCSASMLVVPVNVKTLIIQRGRWADFRLYGGVEAPEWVACAILGHGDAPQQATSRFDMNQNRWHECCDAQEK